MVFVFTIVLLSSFIGYTALAQEVIIENENPLELEEGESIQLEAIFQDAEGEEVDTTFIWSVHPGFLGLIDSLDVFYANRDGEGILIASVGEFADTITVIVEGEPAPDQGVYILTEEFELEVGEMIQLAAVYYDENGNEVAVEFTWSVDPENLGTVDAEGIFEALAAGEGTVTATYGEFSDTVNFEIEEEGGEDPEEGPALTVVPGDTVLSIGSQVQFEAFRADTLVDATWSTFGGTVGTLSETGLLDVTESGFTFVQASNEIGSGTSLIIAEEEADTAGTNTITITRTTPNPQGYSVMAEITEGESWTIGGLPRPMNVLNGGMIYFPHGSLHEDIRLHVDLPGFAEHHGDSVGYGGNIVSGVQFRVMVNDTVIEPYYFDDPLFVGLVFKRGLLRNMGIDPQDLALYFAMEDGDTIAFDTTGISNTVVDSVRNAIFSNVIHFSDLVIAPSPGSAGVDDLETGAGLPAQFYLEQNYPNPFNAATSIRFNLTTRSEVRLYVYDILGREVTRLVQGIKPSGYHTVTFNGSHLASGIYYIRLGDSNSWIQARKMTLIK
jgi:hypothetical protein